MGTPELKLEPQGSFTAYDLFYSIPSLLHTTGGHINNYLVLERFYINKKNLFPSAVLK